MKIALFAIVAIVSVAAVTAMRCHGGDTSQCTGFSCTQPDTVVGCEHDVCTCVPGMSCDDIADCGSFSCDHHDQSAHCVDKSCMCIHMDPGHGPGHGPN